MTTHVTAASTSVHNSEKVAEWLSLKYSKSLFAKTFLLTSLFKLAGFTRKKKKKTPVTMFPGLPAFHFSHPHLHSRQPPLAPLEALPIASSASGPPRSPWAKSSTRSPGSNEGRHGGRLFGERFREGGVWLWNHLPKSVKRRTEQLKIWLFWMTSMNFVRMKLTCESCFHTLRSSC